MDKARITRRNAPRAYRTAVLGGVACLLLIANAAPPAVAETIAPQLAQAVALEVPAQPLDQAIAAFEAQTGWKVAVDQALLAGKRSSAVRGNLAPEVALRQLLAGTGLDVTVTAPGRVALAQSVTPLPAIPVEGEGTDDRALIGNLPAPYAGGQVAKGAQAGILGNRDDMDTPFSVHAYTEEAIKNRQARSIADIVDYDSSVRVISSRGGYTDQYMIRGFTVFNDDLAFNGMYGVLPRQTLTPEAIERVEVFQGPSALLNGVSPGGTIGGTINLVPKRATDEPINEVALTYSSDLQFGTAVDFGRRFGPDRQFGVRFNGAVRAGDTAADQREQLIGLAALGADYQGERLRLSLDVGYQHQDYDRPQNFTYISPGIDMPKAPDAKTNNQDSWTYTDTRDIFGVLRGEYDLTDHLTVYGAFGGNSSDQFSASRGITVLNDEGEASGIAADIPYYRDTISAQAGLRATGSIFGITQAATVAANTVRFEEGFGFGFGALNNTNIYDPSYDPEPDFSNNTIGKSNETQLNSVALADVVGLWDDRVQFTLGGRLQQVKVTAFDFSTGAETSAYDEHALTPALGLVIRPIKSVSLYANYIEGLTPGDVAPATATNAGQAFKPYRTDQVEFGVKLDFEVLTASLAFFQINRPNAYLNGTNTFVDDGNQRNRGIELSLAGEPLKGVRLLGGVTLLDSKLSGTLDGDNDGNRGVGVPNAQANIGGEFDIPQVDGLTVTSRVIYTGTQYYDAANTQELQDWARWDFGLRYTLDAHGTPITFRADVENLLDSSYWSSAGGGYLSMGAPRTVRFSTAFRF
ncbi:TonB-dependent siderophore receptor [Dongia sedimenti]|uniref:TonB-dependent receptor n=1 Tax=Dongia sedimenti TaxID=3064282 RepID=A0ABU0YLQ8_9PROT|nr:TonB-dependent receptor [Rhodospirillaceae bacterium R-7]